MARNRRKVGTPERALQLACNAIGEPDAVALTLHPTKYRERPELIARMRAANLKV